MREERLEVSVTFDERHGYVGSAPELRSAGGGAQPGRPAPQDRGADAARRRRVVLQLDGLAERERHRRRA